MLLKQNPFVLILLLKICQMLTHPTLFFHFHLVVLIGLSDSLLILRSIMLKEKKVLLFKDNMPRYLGEF